MGAKRVRWMQLWTQLLQIPRPPRSLHPPPQRQVGQVGGIIPALSASTPLLSNALWMLRSLKWSRKHAGKINPWFFSEKLYQLRKPLLNQISSWHPWVQKKVQSMGAENLNGEKTAHLAQTRGYKFCSSWSPKWSHNFAHTDSQKSCESKLGHS